MAVVLVVGAEEVVPRQRDAVGQRFADCLAERGPPTRIRDLRLWAGGIGGGSLAL